MTTMLRPSPRHVYVLGPAAGLDLDEAVSRSAKEGAELVLLCIGRRLTPAQRDLVEEALRRVGESRFDLDAQWIEHVSRLDGALGAGDEVTVLVDGRDRARVERIVAGRRRRPTIWALGRGRATSGPETVPGG